MAGERGRPAGPRPVLVRFAGLCWRDVCRRPGGSPARVRAEICYERRFDNDQKSAMPPKGRRASAAVRRCRISWRWPCCSVMAYGGLKWWQVQQLESIARPGDADRDDRPAAHRVRAHRAERQAVSLDRHAGQGLGGDLFLHDLPRQLHAAQPEHQVHAQPAGAEGRHLGQHHLRPGQRHARSALRSTPTNCKADPERWLFLRGPISITPSASAWA